MKTNYETWGCIDEVEKEERKFRFENKRPVCMKYKSKCLSFTFGNVVIPVDIVDIKSDF